MTNDAVVVDKTKKASNCKENDCPKWTDPTNFEKLVNYDPVWRDGDLICSKCGKYIGRGSK